MKKTCENAACVLNQLGNCFGARFLGEQPSVLRSDEYWLAKAEEENSRRRQANMAPVQPDFLRREHIKDTRYAWQVAKREHCRRSDRALGSALRAYDVIAAPFL